MSTLISAAAGRLKKRFVTPQDYAYLVTGAGPSENWQAAIQAAWNFGAANKIKVRMSGRDYPIFGQLNTRSNLHVEFDNDAWLLPKAWSTTGSIVTNVTGVAGESVQSNVLFTNPQIDGAGMPVDGLSNDNAMGFASGMSNIRILGGTIKNIAFSWTAGGAGGKAVNLEQGVTDAMVSGTQAENCGIGFFVQGRDGVGKNTTRILFTGVIARNCGAAFAALGINTAADPDGDPSDMLVTVDGLTFYNCGHSPDRPVASDFQKSGAIVFGEAQNIRIDNIKGYNDAAYTATWPAGGAGVVGAGLAGPIGAVIWGWGRNISIGNVEYNGDCDSLIRINRARAMGEDAAPTAKPQNVFRFDVDTFRHYGTAQTVLALDANAAARVDVAEVNGMLKGIISDVLTVGIMDASLAGYLGLYCEVFEQSSSRSVRGTAGNIQASLNTFATYRGQEQVINGTLYATFLNSDRFSGREITLADDTAIAITPPKDSGILALVSDTSLLRVMIGFRVGVAGAQCVNMGNAVSLFAVTTGALAGTTAADTNFTVAAHTDGKLYLENRRGGAVAFTMTMIG